MEEKKMEEKKGLTIVYTGNGKGKTTAALGLGLRAWGQGMKVLMLQFIKGTWRSGEHNAAAKLGDGFDIKQFGKGFLPDANSKELVEHQEAAREALHETHKALLSQKYDLVICDEINYAIKRGLIEIEDVIKLIERKPGSVHLLLTGRNAPLEIVAMADLVSEIIDVKHPYSSGIPAQRGIEF